MRITATPGIDSFAALPSPDGEHIVLAGAQNYVWPVARWLHRWIRFVPVEPQRRWLLWSSCIDGSRLHEIGYVNLLHEYDDSPDAVEWLPGSQRVSFVYRGALYTVGLD